MTVRETSKKAFFEIVDSGELCDQEKRIIDYVKRFKRPVTRREIEAGTGISISSVCGRVNSLVNKHGVLKELEAIKCPITGRTVHPVQLAG